MVVVKLMVGIAFLLVWNVPFPGFVCSIGAERTEFQVMNQRGCSAAILSHGSPDSECIITIWHHDDFPKWIRSNNIIDDIRLATKDELSTFSHSVCGCKKLDVSASCPPGVANVVMKNFAPCLEGEPTGNTTENFENEGTLPQNRTEEDIPTPERGAGKMADNNSSSSSTPQTSDSSSSKAQDKNVSSSSNSTAGEKLTEAGEPRNSTGPPKVTTRKSGGEGDKNETMTTRTGVERTPREETKKTTAHKNATTPRPLRRSGIFGTVSNVVNNKTT